MTTRSQSQAQSQASGGSGNRDGDSDSEEEPTPSDFTTYSDLHRYMLQGLIYAGILDAKGVKGLFNGACVQTKHHCEEKDKLPNIQRVVTKINAKIKDFNMAIKTATCELTGKKYYTFIMTIEDPMAKFQKTFTALELDMFMHCVDIILRKTDTYSVSETACVQIAREKDTSSKRSNALADSFVEKMLSMLYFTQCPGPSAIEDGPNHITLGPRTMKEFECVLRESYQDAVTKCCLCLHPLLHGYQCPNKSVCKNVVHLSCHKNFAIHSVDCPGCKAPWIPITRLIRRVKEVVEDEEGDDTDVNEMEVNGDEGLATEED